MPIIPTDVMEQSPSWEADSCSGTQEISCVFSISLFHSFHDSPNSNFTVFTRDASGSCPKPVESMPWRWRQCVSPKLWNLRTSPHGVKIHKNNIVIFTAVRTSNPSKIYFRTKILFVGLLYISFTRPACILDLIILIIFGDKYFPAVCIRPT
jgi:hypothetical protein